MKILGVDSTADTAAAALVEDSKVLASYSAQTGNTHSTTLLPMIESVLSVFNIKASDIGLFALSAGPGSFTGVRIGAAALKGLAFADNIPCVGVSSLEAMAWNLKELRGIVTASINARRGTLFFAAFECDGVNPPRRLTPDDTLTVSEVCDYIKARGGDIYAVGDGAELIEKEIGDGVLSPVPVLLKKQNAAGVCLLAEEIWRAASEDERCGFTNGNLLPVYLKKPQAEREREERLKNEKSN